MRYAMRNNMNIGQMHVNESSTHYMTQDELETYCRENLNNKWKDVVKTAWIKVIEKAKAGKKYETVTRDEDGGTWKETVNVAKPDDFVIQNAYGSGKNKEVDDKKDPSRWLLSGSKIAKNYIVKGDVEPGKCYQPVKVVRKGIMLKEPIKIIASWGEEMNCKKGDWLVKAGDKDVYRVDKTVFDNTYEVIGDSSMNESSKAHHTRKQILEAIQYWKKQLENGNFLDESTVEGMNRIEKPMRRVHRSGAPLTVAELIEASRNLYDNQQNAPLNAGIDGQIYGQVNNVIDDNGKCILTLAPYKNGRRSKDLSVNGDRSPAISFDEIVKEVKSMPLHSEVVVKMKDPYGFGPKAAVPVEQEIEAFDIDSAYGLFLRLV